MRPGTGLLICVLCTSACASRPHEATTARQVEEPIALDGLRLSTRDTARGVIVDAYDAKDLFARALREMNRGEYAIAHAAFDRVTDEFPDSQYVSAALYNAGLCLQRLEKWQESAHRYERLLSVRPESRDAKHANFQLAFLYQEMGQWDNALATARQLTARQDLDSDERAEAMARHASALFGKDDIVAAADVANRTLRFYRTRQPGSEVRDPYFVASANFTLAETIRLRSEAIALPDADVDKQREVLERRAQLLLQAQRTYFDTIRLTDAYWASAAGYRIGAMYERFWHAIMTAPVPPPKSELNEAGIALYRQEYRHRLAELVRPLTRHAIRYWELTLVMVERTGVHSEWTEQIRASLERAKERLLQRADTSPGTEVRGT